MILENKVSQHGVFFNKSSFSMFTKGSTDCQERFCGWDRLGEGHGILDRHTDNDLHDRE